RDSTFAIAGILVHLVALGALIAPWTVLLARNRPWMLFLLPLASVALVLAVRAPLTFIQRHRFWSLLGVDIPATPGPAGTSQLLRAAASLRTESPWRQLIYHLAAGPLLALGGL